VERVPNVPFVGAALAVVGVVPTERGGTVRTVEILFGGRVECAALLVGNGEFHDGSAAHFHVSDRPCGYIKTSLGSRTADTEQTAVAQAHDKAYALLSSLLAAPFRPEWSAHSMDTHSAH